MKVERAIICGNCDEIYDGPVCPVCGFDEGFPISKSLMSLPQDGRVRLLTSDRNSPGNIVKLIQVAGDKLKGMESLQ